MKIFVYPGAALLALVSGAAAAASCPPVTVADAMGVGAGAFPQQFELSEFESLANCTLSFNGNPQAAALNARIRGNGKLPSVAKRRSEERFSRNAETVQ